MVRRGTGVCRRVEEGEEEGETFWEWRRVEEGEADGEGWDLRRLEEGEGEGLKGVVDLRGSDPRPVMPCG
jgi:hypothetical protein